MKLNLKDDIAYDITRTVYCSAKVTKQMLVYSLPVITIEKDDWFEISHPSRKRKQWDNLESLGKDILKMFSYFNFLTCMTFKKDERQDMSHRVSSPCKM